MGNFELVFSLEAKRKKGDKIVVGDSGLVKRVIIADNKEIAEKLGLAMVGEEIFPMQYIKTLLSVGSTASSPFLNSFSGEYTWGRVLARLGLEESDTLFNYRTREKPTTEGLSAGRVIKTRAERIVEKVGIELNYIQRRHVLSLTL